MNHMKQKILYLCLLLLPLTLWAENASNVRVRQRNKDIIVTYDLSKSSYVQLSVATDSSTTYNVLTAVEGAVGAHVRPGTNREIIWHPLEENDNFIAHDVRFKVETLNSYAYYALPKSHGKQQLGGKTNMETFITLNAAITPDKDLCYGLTLGQTYSGIGWYINAHTNLKFDQATDGMKCEKGGVIDGEVPFYSGNKKVSVFAANAGVVVDIIDLVGASKRNRFNTFGVYAGGGYGWRRMLWETTDGKWIQYNPGTFSTVSLNGGIIGSVYGLTLKAGVNTIGFKYLEVEAGIGWMF